MIDEQAGHVLACSSFIETEPWGFSSDNAFLNAVVKIDTLLTPHELLRITQEIERTMGRTHKSINGNYSDRIIDIDILLYEELTVHDAELTIPHPLMWQRNFVYDNVRTAEVLMPASDISEQISMAGKEASGTGCMKFMINGALTIGTLDGANVEMKEAVGDDNIFIFGLNAKEVDELWEKGYRSLDYYAQSARIRKTVDRLNKGFNGVSFSNIANYLIGGYGVSDPYMCLADFDSYYVESDNIIKAYNDKERWGRMSIINIAQAGFFAADRSIKEYAENIWDIKSVK